MGETEYTTFVALGSREHPARDSRREVLAVSGAEKKNPRGRPPTPKTKLSKAVHAAMERAGIESQRTLALRLGWSERTLRSYLSGDSQMPASRLIELALLLRADPAKLLSG